MGDRARRPCAQTGCPNYVTEGSYCDTHRHNNARTRYDADRAAHDPIRKLYFQARWIKLSQFLRRRNAQCQRMKNGLQCWKPSEVAHHLVSPYERPELFYVPTNLICLCADCHPGGVAGTPDWQAGVDYEPSQFEISIGVTAP
jgi:hypothetical protein